MLLARHDEHMERRQALRLFSGAAIAAPVAAIALPATTASAATAPATRPAAPPSGTRPRPGVPTLQHLLDAERDAGMIGTFARVHDRGRTSELESGCADTATRRPPRTAMRHRVGDITKTFTAAVVVQLACEGRLDLDKPICDYLPDLVPGELGMMVTVRMLLNHTSCIADYSPAVHASAEAVVDACRTAYTPAALVACGLALTGDVMPGSMFLYSDTNYVILGCLIEKVGGRTYEQEVERRILRPLCLDDTYFPGSDMRIRGSHMTAYVPAMGMLCDVTEYDMSYAWAAGALISTADDVQRFYTALLGGRLLPSMGLREMLTTVPVDEADAMAGDYGLGIKCMPAAAMGAMSGKGGTSGMAGMMLWGHDGYAPGHTSFAWNSQDGRSIQLFQAENLNWYAGPHGNPANPIDKARDAFQAAACS